MSESSMDLLSKYIPGFGAYRSEQKKRDDDVAVRKYLIDRLQECKRELQAFLTPLVEQSNFSAITQGEKLRGALELAQSKMRSTVEGYSSWFESSRIDESKLKQVVDLDNDLIGVIDRLQQEISNLFSTKPDFTEAQKIVVHLKDRFASRNELLSKSH